MPGINNRGPLGKAARNNSMNISNEVHKVFIEETGNFSLAESLDLSNSANCAILGKLVLVPEDAMNVQHHQYNDGRR